MYQEVESIKRNDVLIFSNIFPRHTNYQYCHKYSYSIDSINVRERERERAKVSASIMSNNMVMTSCVFILKNKFGR